MPGLKKINISTFLKLLNRNGYVLDFTTNDFDEFTKESIGIPLCQKYGRSKGASLEAYLHDAPNDKVYKLLSDLLTHYEDNYELEYLDGGGNVRHSRYNPEFASLYRRCHKLLDEAQSSQSLLDESFEGLKGYFSSEYISKQFDAMKDALATNPTEAIGKAKELLESCCKTILDRCGAYWSETWKLSKLADSTLECLKLKPVNAASDSAMERNIKALLGNLRAIVESLSEMRNAYGSGHGKSASFIGLESRHANLAVNSCIAFVAFVWESYESQKVNENLEAGQ